jgi:signal peptidase
MAGQRLRKGNTMAEEKKAPVWKRVVDLVVNAVCAVIVIFVLVISISSIMSAGKGYTNVFGYSFMTVSSESMVGDNPDSFDKGDVISVRVIASEDAAKLQEQLKKLKGSSDGQAEDGDIITYWSQDSAQNPNPQANNGRFINTHRIVRVELDASGNVDRFITKGDNNPIADVNLVAPADIIGVYGGKSSVIGSFLLWMQSTTGFMVMVIVPSLLVVAYCIFLVIKQVMLRSRSKVKEIEADLYEQAKREAMEELLRQQAEQKNADKSPLDTPPKADK